MGRLAVGADWLKGGHKVMQCALDPEAPSCAGSSRALHHTIPIPQMSLTEYPAQFAEIILDAGGELDLTERAIEARQQIIDHIHKHQIHITSSAPLSTAPMSSFDYPKHFAEMVPDGEGGMRLSARAVEARGQIISQLNAHKVPMDQLPTTFNVRHNPRAPELLFGFHISRAHLLDYGVDQGLIPADYQETMTRRGATYPIVRHLRDITDAMIYLRIPYSLHPGEMVICLYTNYTMEKERYIESDEKEILEIIKDEFKISGGPMWYWDTCNP